MGHCSTGICCSAAERGGPGQSAVFCGATCCHSIQVWALRVVDVCWDQAGLTSLNTQANSRIAWINAHTAIQTQFTPTARIPRLHLPCIGPLCLDNGHSPAGKHPSQLSSSPAPNRLAPRGTARHRMAQHHTARHRRAQRLPCTETRSAAHAARPTQRSQPLRGNTQHSPRSLAHAAQPALHGQPELSGGPTR